MAFSQEDQLKYKSLYLQTAREYVKELQNNLQLLSQGTQTPEVIDTLHRDAHSLKGQSLMMGYHSLGELSLFFENIFNANKENKLKITDDLITLLTESVKEIEVSLNEIEKNNKELDLYQTIEKLKVLVPAL